MIVKTDPKDGATIRIADDLGGQLTTHAGPDRMMGLVVSDQDGPRSTAAVLLTADDRRALAAALLEGL